MKKELLTMIAKDCFKIGDFTLTSGKKSKYYINCRPLCLHNRGSYLIGKIVEEQVFKNIDAIGGLTFGADPISMATMMASRDTQRQLNAFSIRKELKTHGVPNWIEGNLEPGSSVCIVDDVLTTGGSLIKAIDRVIEMGHYVKQIVVLVDREENNAINEIYNHLCKKVETTRCSIYCIFTRIEIENRYNKIFSKK